MKTRRKQVLGSLPVAFALPLLANIRPSNLTKLDREKRSSLFCHNVYDKVKKFYDIVTSKMQSAT